MNRLLIALAALWLGLAPASAQNEYPSPTPGKTVQSIVVMCLNVSGQAVPCSLGTPLQVTGTFSASIGGFQGSGLFATLTATGSSSASTALPTGTTVNISNTGTTAVSCTFATGAAVGVANNLIVQPSSSRSRVVGSFDHVACIDQTGSVSNVVVLEGGTGLGNDSGGGGSSGGAGGAVTLAATSVSSGAYVAGSIGSGAFASGALSSGSIASGAFASGSIASGAFASGSIGAGAQIDLLTMRGTKAPGTAAANSLLAGCVYTAAGVSMADGQQVACQTDITGNLKVSGIGVAQGSPTSGQTLSLIGGAAATSPPTTTAGNTYPLSMDALGGLRTSTLNNGVGATGSAVPANAVLDGCRAQSAEATVATAGNLTAAACDLVGKQIVLPYSNPENFVRGSPAAVTTTTSTQIIAAPAAGLRNYITQIACQNSHATVGTWVNIQDGSGGTTIWQIYAGPLGGGAGPTFNTPLQQPTTATGLFFASVTTGANVVCNANGYKGA